jgi:hypothetical protein
VLTKLRERVSNKVSSIKWDMKIAAIERLRRKLTELHVDNPPSTWRKLAFINMEDLGFPNGLTHQSTKGRFMDAENRLLEFLKKNAGITVAYTTLQNGNMNYMREHWQDEIDKATSNHKPDGLNTVRFIGIGREGHYMHHYIASEVDWEFPMPEIMFASKCKTFQAKNEVKYRNFELAHGFACIQKQKLDLVQKHENPDAKLQALDHKRQIMIIDAIVYEAEVRFMYFDQLQKDIQIQKEYGDPKNAYHKSEFYNEQKLSQLEIIHEVIKQIKEDTQDKTKSQNLKQYEEIFEKLLTIQGNQDQSETDNGEAKKTKVNPFLNNRETSENSEKIASDINFQYITSERQRQQEQEEIIHVAQRYFKKGDVKDLVVLKQYAQKQPKINEIIELAEHQWEKRNNNAAVQLDMQEMNDEANIAVIASMLKCEMGISDFGASNS